MIRLHIRRNVVSLLRTNLSSLCNSNVCSSFSFINFSTCTDPQSAKSPVEYLKSYHFSPEVFSRAASVLSRSKNPNGCSSVLSFFNESGFTGTQIEKIVNFNPEFLMANVEESMEPEIKALRSLGMGGPEVAKIISRNPVILYRKRIILSLSILNGLIGSNEAVIKILRRCAWYLAVDLNKTMVPNIEFLKSCGIPMEHIVRHMCYFPRFILRRPEIVTKSVEKVDEIWINRSSLRFMYAVGVVSCLSKGGWELKLKTYQKFGFSEEEILDMFRRVPQMFLVSEEKIRNVLDFLLVTGKYTRTCIFGYPKSLMYSIETRYKPRLQALEDLEQKNLVEKWPSLGTICRTSDTQFFGMYIYPFSNEVGDVRLEGVDSDAKKSRSLNR